MIYLIPSRAYRIEGDTHAAHIDDNGKPLCGAALTEPYATTGWLCAYNVCEVCQRCAQRRERLDAIQMELFA